MLAKASLLYLLLNVVQINYIFSDKVRILYIYIPNAYWFLGKEILILMSDLL